MKHRVFVAINLPSAIKETLLRTIIELKKRELPVRIVSENNLHLTLKFLDLRTDKEIEFINQALLETIVCERSFELILNSVKIFPSKNAARVIAVDLRSSQRISKIQEKINQRLNEFTFLAKENRKFKPHITLARIDRMIDWKTLKRVEYIPIEGQGKISSIELMESDLSDKIPRYTVIKNYPLLHES